VAHKGLTERERRRNGPAFGRAKSHTVSNK
jgi:hypothetical protein